MTTDDGDASAAHSYLPEWAWKRHANPWSGWTRVAITPLAVFALYRRNWRLLALALVWTVLNPITFPPPKNADAWMTRGVLAEQEWLDAGNGTVGTAWPNLLNLLNVPATAYLGWATLRRRPVHAVLATVLVTGLKLLWVDEIIEATELDDPDDLPVDALARLD